MNIFRNVARADERVHRCGCVLNSEGFFFIRVQLCTGGCCAWVGWGETEVVSSGVRHAKYSSAETDEDGVG